MKKIYSIPMMKISKGDFGYFMGSPPGAGDTTDPSTTTAPDDFLDFETDSEKGDIKFKVPNVWN